jgi:hypothetical protein
MLTFEESYTKAQRVSGDFTSDTLLTFKEDINIGNQKLNAAINNYFTRKSKATSLIEDQQYYQSPPDCVRVIGVDFLQSSSTRRQPVYSQVRSEYQWRQLNFNQQSGNWITYYFVKGADEIGLYPIPSATVSGGLIIYYEPKAALLTQSDFTAGTVTATNGSQTITHSGTGFTQEMVGRGFKVTDGSDGYDYKIAGFTSSSVLTLEEPFVGYSSSGKTFKIGETFAYPSEYHDAPLDYALSRFFETNNNTERAEYYYNEDPRRLGRFNRALASLQEKYASSSASQVITAEPPVVNPWSYQITNVAE